MRILIVGAGATGGYFGGRLVEAGRDVTFLVRPRRAEQLRQHGLQILSPHGDIILDPKLVTADRIDGPYDVVMLTVKSYGLDSALDDMARAVGPDTMIFPVLNGMRHVDALIARFGEKPVLGGACQVVSTLDAVGRVRQLADHQQLIYGERSGTRSDRVEALDRALQDADFIARVSDDILQEMWEKWIALATLGAITCLLRGAVGDIEAAPGGTAIALQVLEDCVAVATCSGHPPSEPVLAWIRAFVTEKGSKMSPSMYRDLSHGLPVEADQIVGDMLARAEGFGITSPLLAAAYANLTIYQRGISAA